MDHFFEGPWMFERGGKYYMSYAASYPNKGPDGKRLPGQQFDYAIADHPDGPYKFMGAFTDSRGGNIHGSQVEWNGVWYCFYHDFSMSVGRNSHGYKRGIRCDDTAAGSVMLVWILAVALHLSMHKSPAKMRAAAFNCIWIR